MINKGKVWSQKEKDIIRHNAHYRVKSRKHMEKVVAPDLAKKLGRTPCAVAKQIEKVLGKHYKESF